MKPTLTIGTQGLLAPTPGYIKTIYRVLMFLSIIWLTAIEPRFPSISASVLHNIDMSLAIGNIAVYAFCNCFGYVCPDNTTYTPKPEEQPVKQP